MLAYITGTVDQELLLRNEYLVAENRILKAQLKERLSLSDAERAKLGEIGHRLGRNAGKIWSGLLEERQNFAGQVNCQQRKPGQVAAGMRQTCNKSEANRVRHNDKHDGNRACDLLQRNGTGHRYSDGDIDITFDKLPCKNRIPIDLLGGKLVQEFDVFALDVTEIAKRLDEHREVLTLFFRAAGMPEHADSGDLPA
jgi:hypothetical protein